MAEDLGTLIAKLTADVSDIKRSLAEGRNSLQEFKTMAQGVGQSVRQALTFVGVTVGIYELASALKEFATDAAMVGARTETLNIAMEQVGKTYGVSAQSLKFYVDELKSAGITTQESMTAVTKALTTGIPLDQLKALATRARDIAVVANVNTSEALNRMMHGIISGEQETLRRLMIQVGHTDDIYKRFAATLGKTKEELNSVEKTQAMLNEVMRLSAGFAGIAAAADATVGKQIASMARFAEEAKNALWALFGPVMSAAIQEMIKGWQNLKQWADANQTALGEWGQEVGNWVGRLVQAVRSSVEWAAANTALLKSLLELYVISKVMTWVQALSLAIKGAAAATVIFQGVIQGLVPVLLGAATTTTVFQAGLAGMTTALTTATAAGAALSAMMFLLLPGIVAVSGALAVYGAYKTFTQPADVAAMPEAAMGAPEAWFAGGAPPPAAAKRGPLTVPTVDPEAIRRKADADAKAAIQKAMANAPKPDGKGAGKGAGAGAEGLNDRLLSETLKMLKAKREAELQDAENSLTLLKSTNELKRAELAKSLAAELIDGQKYYQDLQALQQTETDAALALIEKKKQIQIQAHREALANLSDKTLPGFKDLSEEARAIARQTLEAHHAKEMSKLTAESAKAKLEGEVKVTEELKRQVEVARQYWEKTEDLNVESAQLLGAISTQEATLQRLVLEWQRAKADAIRAGGYTPEFAAAQDQNLAAKKADVRFGGYAAAITQGFADLVDAMLQGGRDLKAAANSMFKSLFNEAMKPGLDMLKGLLVNGFKQLFGDAGSAISSAVMGVIGLVGMLLTSGGGNKSFSSSGVQSNITSSKEVRGIIAGETSLPIAEINVGLMEALVPTNGILRQIEANTRGGGGRSTVNLNVNGQAQNESAFTAKVRQIMDNYFMDYLAKGAR